MKLFTFLLFTLVIGVVVDAQRGNFGANRNENGPGILEVLYSNFLDFINPTKAPRKMNNYRGRILNNNHRDNNRLEMLDEDVITIAPSVVVPSVTGNLYLGSIFERIFQIPIATLESVRNMLQTKNRYLSSEG